MIASGVAGLGYQIAWTRMFSAGLGHEVPGMLAVVSAFFAGLALGAFTLDRAVGRARRPGLWYVGLELAIGLWALATVALIPFANELAYTLIGAESDPVRHWLVAFLIPAITLLPATTAMGATLPRWTASPTRSIRRANATWAGSTPPTRSAPSSARSPRPSSSFPRWATRRQRSLRLRQHRYRGDRLPPLASRHRAGKPGGPRARAAPPGPATGRHTLRHRAARHRVRGARRPRHGAGAREHRLFLRLGPGRVPRGHRDRRGAVPALPQRRVE